MAYRYGIPPDHYQRFETSPRDGGEYVHYFASHETPAKQRGHSRKPSYTSPHVGGYYSPPGDSPPYSAEYATPQRHVYVSTTKDGRARREYYYAPNEYHDRVKPKQAQPIHIYNDDADYAEPHYIYRTPTKNKTRSGRPAADTAFYYGQDQVYEQQARPSATRPRRSSTTTKTKHKSKPSYSAPQATEKDAAAAGISPGYSIKNWDPTELPITLLGSVFDANSLGKWIYDWTVYRYSASHPFADVAGELWLLLIKLAGKMKRGEECLPRIRDRENHELVDEFLGSANRLWRMFKDLLKECEYFMLKAAKREGTKKMGKNAGTEFVDSIFGRDRFLGQTEKLMQKIRTWDHRFDVNCEDILRRPSVA
ncbi:hypothetical protein DV736_g5436, partial [Chaetothyriales sp. CBS 134916]